MAPTPTNPTGECPPPGDVTPEDDTDYASEPDGPPSDWLISLTDADAPDPVED